MSAPEAISTERMELLLKLGGIAIEFDERRSEALAFQQQRNNTAECTTPETVAPLHRIDSPEEVPCWRGKRKRNIDGEVIGPSGTWCAECKERQRLHEQMTNARIARGTALRRLTHWRKRYRELEAA